MHTYMLHMKSMVPTIQEGALYTYLTYITEQIWLHIPNIDHMTYMLNGHTDLNILHI